MYSGENKGHERFVRHEANGQDFEFSDGRFVVNARMEGSTYKPILHLSISPMNQDELGNVMYIKVSRLVNFDWEIYSSMIIQYFLILAPSILKFLGIKPNPNIRNKMRNRTPREKFSNRGAGALPSIDSASSAFSVVNDLSYFPTNSFWQSSYFCILTPTLIALML